MNTNMLTDSKERAAWVAFTLLPGIGPRRFRLLTDYFGSARLAWEANSVQLRQTGLRGEVVDRLLNVRTEVDIDKYYTALVSGDYWDGYGFTTKTVQWRKEDGLWFVYAPGKISVLLVGDKDYPPLLATTGAAPPVLFARHQHNIRISDLWHKPIAVVGSRKISDYGAKIVAKWTPVLVAEGLTIVSGFMYGVDAWAHRETVRCGGKTVAVLGSGIDVVYPKRHVALYNSIIASGGMIVSEYAPGIKPTRSSFPQRNRIVAGMTKVVLVVEAGKNSGSLITARLAAEAGRDVLVVPGSVFSPVSVGTTSLINEGAKAVTGPKELVGVLQ